MGAISLVTNLRTRKAGHTATDTKLECRSVVRKLFPPHHVNISEGLAGHLMIFLSALRFATDAKAFKPL
jgi:hypothetical protein